MDPIIRQPKYGDTIFVPHPFYYVEALVTGATLIHGHSLNSIERLRDGWFKVVIPGLTSITYAPEKMIEV